MKRSLSKSSEFACLAGLGKPLAAGALAALLVGGLVLGPAWAQTGERTKAADKAKTGDKTGDAANKKAAGTPAERQAEQLEKATTDFLTPMLDNPIGAHFDTVKEAIQALAKGSIKDCRDKLVEAQKATPKLPPAEVMLAKLCFSTNQATWVQRARAELEQAVRKSPKDPEAYLILGEIALAEGRTTEARLVLRESVAVNEKYTANAKRKKNCQLRAHAALAQIDEATEKWEAAKAHLTEWVKLDPESAPAQQRLAYTLFQLKQYADAEKALQAAGKIDDKLPPADISLGTYYWRSGDKTSAKKHFDKALAAGTRDFKTRFALGAWLLQTNQIDQAKVHIDEAVKLNTDSMEAVLLQGMIARMKLDFEVARKCFEKVVLHSPSNTAAINQLALTLAESANRTDKTRALDYANTNYKNNQQSVEAAATLGWVLHKLGRMDEANRAFSAVANAMRTGLSPEVAYYFATFLSERDQGKEAVNLLEQALDMDRPFMYRAQAQKLLSELKSGKVSSTSRASSTADKK
jgi:tetratricopeptide (TPR) repeat protein